MSGTSSRIVLAPLTTTYTAAAQCTVFGAPGNNASANVFYAAQACSGGSPHDNSRCLPSATVSSSVYPLGGLGVFSPGLVCPSGYTAACTQIAPLSNALSVAVVSTSYSFQFQPSPGETAVGCCPTSFSCSTDYLHPESPYQTCRQDISTGFVSIATCSGSNLAYDEITKVSINGPTTLFAPMVQLVYKSSDLPSATTSSASRQTSSNSSTGSVAAGTTTASIGQNTGAQDTSGLSTGAKIGIGVGVPLGILLLVALGTIIFLRRRKASNRGPMIQNSQPFEMASDQKHQQGYAQKVPVHNMSHAPLSSELTSETGFSQSTAFHELPPDSVSPLSRRSAQ